MRRIPVLLSAALAAGVSTLLLGTAGCGTVNTASTRTEPSADSVVVNRRINDAFNAIFLKVKDVRRIVTRGGVLEAQVDVANDDFFTRNFSYRFEWYDERGNVIDSGTAWRATSVPAGDRITISETATDVLATDFSVRVRRAG